MTIQWADPASLRILRPEGDTAAPNADSDHFVRRVSFDGDR
jgi:hypothetical protein